MNMKPILFNTDMVRALLANRKTVTRRVVKPQPDERLTTGEDALKLLAAACAPYQTGDILYVRETWDEVGWFSPGIGEWNQQYIYRASYQPNLEADVPTIKWRPSIHMPCEAARIFLKVTGVRVERLQEICGQGLIDEGLFSLDELRCGMMRDKFSAFEKLWDATIKPAGRARYGWETNPWVWAIEFERISREEAAKINANST